MVFEENVKMINDHNANLENTYTMGINKFADMTKAEFVATFMDHEFARNKVKKETNFKETNESYDWRSSTTVRDMKSGCISSWAFSAVAAAESYLSVVKSTKASLSVQ